MTKETTPRNVTDAITTLCNAIHPTVEPYFVQCYPFPGTALNECFPNVNSVISTVGGEAITGWAIWQWANIMVEAEAHAIWKSPDGQLVDITPHNNNENQILFLPDDTVTYKGTPIPSHRLALTDSPLVAELIALSNQKDQIAATSDGMTFALPVTVYNRMQELQALLHRSAGRNEPCPCGSGIKYKKCCGRYE